MDIIEQFIEAINRADVASMLDCMAEQHIFKDSRENTITNASLIEKAWKAYFVMFPDYEIEVVDRIREGDALVLLGYASGTYKMNSSFWRVPTAWRVEIQDDKISYWQVYADNSVVLEAMKEDEL